MASDKPKAPLPTYEQALDAILPHAPSLGEETVALSAALGSVLLRGVDADRDQPPFDRSAMDGFAVRSGEVRAGGRFPVAGSVAAGGAVASFMEEMPAGSVRRIATGAPLPRGADAVIPIEVAAVTTDQGRENVSFVIDNVMPWQNVHRRASDASRGQSLLTAGTRLQPQHIGIAAAVGAAELVVSQRPRITLLTTGDEVRTPEINTADLQPQQIRNSNGPMVAALLEAMGVPLLRHEHVPDEPELTLAAAREALSHSHLVVTIGGVSVGQRDFLPGAWQRLGLETVLHGVNIQPGKPVLVMRDENKLVLGLPGNPVSVLATAHLFLWPVIRRMLGCKPAELPWQQVVLADPVKPTSKRQVFRAAELRGDNTARVIHWHGSGDLVHTLDANGFVRLPLRDEPVPAGTVLPFLPMLGV